MFVTKEKGKGFRLIEEQHQEQKLRRNGGAEGQIKIDLSVESYDGAVWRFDHYGNKRFTSIGIKPPTLKKIQQVLKATGASISRIYTEGHFTIIDYTT